MKTTNTNQIKPTFYLKKQSTEAQKEAMRAKREELKTISKTIKLAVKEGVYSSVNEGLIEWYAKQGHGNLKTINQWNHANMIVKKGEKALLLWGSPTSLKTEKEEQETDESKETFYPLCFVFSENQVQPMGAK
jgi:hypothetical protein